MNKPNEEKKPFEREDIHKILSSYEALGCSVITEFNYSRQGFFEAKRWEVVPSSLYNKNKKYYDLQSLCGFGSFNKSLTYVKFRFELNSTHLDYFVGDARDPDADIQDPHKELSNIISSLGLENKDIREYKLSE